MQNLLKAFARPIGQFVLTLAVLGFATAALSADDEAAALNAKIDQLISQLGDADYHVRQQAQDELAKLRLHAFDALTAAETHEDLEVATRAKYLLRLMRVQWTVDSDPPEVKKCMEGYGLLDTNGRIERIQRLAALPGGMGATALRRLVRFEQNPDLLYAIAQIYKAQGKGDMADEAAQRALRLHSGPGAEQLRSHLMTAYNLRQRGLFKWAEQEYRHVIATGAAANNYTVAAHYGLSEMFHDQGQDLPAAEALQAMVKSIEKDKIFKREFSGRTLDQVRARMEFFFACHWREKGDRVKQKEHLDKALQVDPGDIDVLIACYRLPDPKPEFRKKIIDTIKKTAASDQAKIANTPDDSTPYNQYAWLIANTEGDIDRAIAYSRKSIELKPDYGGYYDTLAHCYFAKGDCATAVKYQVKAAEMEPHSGQIRKQLELFRKKLEEKKAAAKKAGK